MRLEPDFQNIVSQFAFRGSFLHGEPFGFGHINDTYVVEFQQPDDSLRKYILQRINHFVFKNSVGVMENIEMVTAHLRRKIAAAGGNPDRETLTLVRTRAGRAYLRTEEGFFWRSFTFIEGARTYQTPTNLQQVYQAGFAFGKFLHLLADFPVERLSETIPDFHHTPKRYQALLQAVEADQYDRAQTVQKEIEFAADRSGRLGRLVDLMAQGKLPVRVTHNDTKFNNVLIDDITEAGVCVVDLDTVMPGCALYDFGDAIRSITNTAEEDQQDLSRVGFSLERYEQYARGYLDATRNILTHAEIDLLAFSAWLMTLECGIRFLTDYLNGDVYFRTSREGQNLDRCRTQFKLIEEMETQTGEMAGIIRQLAAGTA